MGVSQVMPERVVDWLVEEAAAPFLRGEVFLAPAELVGVDPIQNLPGAEAIAQLTAGRLLRHSQRAAAFMSLEIPAIDDMSPASFSTFLEESQDDLARFRVAFRRLAESQAETDLEDLVADVKAEVVAMQQGAHYGRLRRNLSLLGGALGTTTAGIAAATGAAAPMPVVASAAGAAAAACLVDLVKQATERRRDERANSFHLFWQLGLDRGAKVKAATEAVRVTAGKRRFEQVADDHPETHWLCSPNSSPAWLAVRREDGS